MTDLKSIIEAVLFISNSPITGEQLKEVLHPEEISIKEIKGALEELNQEYINSNRGFQVEEIAGGWQLRTKHQFSSWVKKFLNIQRRERFSAPALETLAIVAYKQPLTKGEIEVIRGVNVDWVLHSLVEKGLVRTVGRKEIPGRPFLYGTTTRFLEHFGLGNLKDLPEVEELRPKKN